MLKGAQLNFACKHKKTHDNCRKKNHIFVSKMSFVLELQAIKKKYLTYAQNSSFLNIWKENQKWGINTIQLKAVRRERMVVVETSWYRQYFNSSFFFLFSSFFSMNLLVHRLKLMQSNSYLIRWNIRVIT